MLALKIEEASAKIRTGPPLDDARDLSAPCWAGVLPYRLVAGKAEPAPDLAPDVPVPSYVRRPRRPRGS